MLHSIAIYKSFILHYYAILFEYFSDSVEPNYSKINLLTLISKMILQQKYNQRAECDQITKFLINKKN